jgi:hypothetical protein
MFNDSTYYISLTAFDIEGNESGYGPEAYLVAGLPAPQAISDLTISRSENDIVLSWSPVVSDTSGNPLEISYFVVYASSEDPLFIPTPADSIGSVVPPDTSFIDLNATIEPVRFYNVKAVVGNR